MIAREVVGSLRSVPGMTAGQRSTLTKILPADKRTVVIFSSCGETVCTYFTSSNFREVLGYAPGSFEEEGVQFVIARAHPADLPQVLKFMEACHRPAGTWFQEPELAHFECTYRFKHADGGWRWVSQELFVLSLTSGGMLDKVMITFADCTTQKEKLAQQHLATLEAKGHNSKLFEAIVVTRQKLESQHAPMSSNGKLLTSRERQVLDLVSHGYSSKQIADHLCISKHTVESHRKNLLHKLNAHNVADLIQKAHLL